MVKKKWNELSPLAKIVIVKLAVVDLGLRAWSLADLARRPADQVKGPKAAWAVALTLVNSAGVLPTVYLVAGRKQH